MNTKKTKKKRKRTTALPPKSSHLCLLLCLLCLLFSLSLSLSDVLCGVKIFRRSLTKNSATNSLGYTTLTSYPALSLSFCFYPKSSYFLYPQARIRAHTRGKEVRESEFREREIERERESVCIYYSSFSERKEVKSNTIYNSREE